MLFREYLDWDRSYGDKLWGIEDYLGDGLGDYA